MTTDNTDRFEFERWHWRKGCRCLAGVDEAGRGPLAGPVVASAVVFPMSWLELGLPQALHGLNDSKQLSSGQRDAFNAAIIGCTEIRHAIAQVDADRVDQINILQATHQAMNEALHQLASPPDHVLVDGRPVPTLRFPQTALIQGDCRSYSIAAASILAKVTRDRLMMEYDQQWPEYGFAQHKGYGTASHLAALAKHGPCPIHRRSFAPLRPVAVEQELLLA